MKKRILFMSIFAVAAFAVAAQGFPGGGRGFELSPEDEVALWDELLDLNEVQEDTFLAVILEYGDRIAEITVPGARPDRDLLVSLIEERTASMEEILTEEQIEVFREAMAERRPVGPRG
jgi:hypothetical protein